jgi:hypothetical protein
VGGGESRSEQKEQIVRKFHSSILIAAVAALAVLVAVPTVSAATGAPHKGKVVPKVKKIAFVGTYAGQASSKLDDSGNTAAIAANGTGKGKLIGTGKITGAGTAQASQQPCPPFGGTGKITGIKGAIFFTVVPGSKGCGDDGGHNFSLVGYLKVTKATGVLKKAKGQLRFTGMYGRDDGTFTIKLTGTLKQPTK